jgi:hypothetical protein
MYMFSISASRESTRPADRISISRMSNSKVVTRRFPLAKTSREPDRFDAVHLQAPSRRFRPRFQAAHDGADARGQFARVERLRQIIVGAQFQPDDPVHIFPARRQHDHRHLLVCGAAQDLESIHARQHHVQQHDIGLPCSAFSRLRLPS